MTGLRPLSPSVWSLQAVDRDGARTAQFWRERRQWPDLAVRLRRVPYWPAVPHVIEYRPDDAIDAVLRSAYRHVRARKDYDVYLRRDLRASVDRPSQPE
jgi:hypothetical protein